MYTCNHPDVHELHDWPMFGPKDPEIAHLVEELAYNRGMRLSEIEGIIRQALLDRLKHEIDRSVIAPK